MYKDIIPIQILFCYKPTCLDVDTEEPYTEEIYTDDDEETDVSDADEVSHEEN